MARLPNKYAIAVAFQFAENKFLFVQRNKDKSEYPDLWSLPSMSIKRDEYYTLISKKQITGTLAGKFAKKCFVGFTANSIRVVKIGDRIRKSYHLHLILAYAPITLIPNVQSKKYQNAISCSLQEILDRTNYMIGTCISMLLSNEVSKDYAAVNLSRQYIECSPEIYNSSIKKELDKISTPDLWRLNADNYNLLVNYKSGTDGSEVREVMLDRFMIKYIKNNCSNSEKLIDIGCGNGALVNMLSNQGYNIIGTDLCPNVSKDFNQSLFIEGDIEKVIPKLKKKYSYLIFNLVLQWIEDIEGTITLLEKIISPQGRVLISLIPPEFSRNGRWINDGRQYLWEFENPLPTKPYMTMLNYSVGPLRYFPRATNDYINAFAKRKYNLSMVKYLYIDSMVSDSEMTQLFKVKENISRYTKIPAFLILEFKKG